MNKNMRLSGGVDEIHNKEVFKCLSNLYGKYKHLCTKNNFRYNLTYKLHQKRNGQG